MNLIKIFYFSCVSILIKKKKIMNNERFNACRFITFIITHRVSVDSNIIVGH